MSLTVSTQLRHSLVLLLASQLAACGGSLFKVSKSLEDNHGIPFYPHEIAELHTSSYAQSWYEVTLTTTWRAPAPKSNPPQAKPKARGASNAATPSKGDDAKDKSRTYKTRSTRYVAAQACASAMNAHLSGAPTPARAYKRVADIFIKQTPDTSAIAACKGKVALAAPEALKLDNIEPRPGLQLIATSRKQVTRISKERHYLNVSRAVEGSTEATFKLSDKGTLSEVTAKVEDKSLSTVLSAIPLAEIISTALGLPSATKTDEGLAKRPVIVGIELEAVPVMRVYTLQVTSTSTLELPLTGMSKNVELQIAEKRPGKKAKTKKPDAPTLKFQGAVQLPKPAAKK